MSPSTSNGLAIASFDQVVDAEQLVLVLRALGGSGSSGLLAVQGQDDLVSLTFRQGDIVAADAMNRTMEDALGDVLTQRGVLSPEAFRGLTSGQDSGTALVSETLLKVGSLERHVVLEAVREQIFRHSLQLLRWSEGSLQWVAGGESPYQAGVVPLPVGELLLRSIDELGAAGPLGVLQPDFDCDYRVAEDAEGRFRQRTSKDSFGHDEGTHLLTAPELEVLRKLRAGTTTRELIPNGARQGWQARFALHHLLLAGLIQRQFSGSGQRRREPNRRALINRSAEEGKRNSAQLPELEPEESLLSLDEGDEELSRLLRDPPPLSAPPTIESPDESGDSTSLNLGFAKLAVDDAPLDDDPLDESFDGILGSSSRVSPASSFGSGPLRIEDVLVREGEGAPGNALDDLEDLYGPRPEDGSTRGDWEKFTTLLNTWGVRFLALVLLALLVRLLVGGSPSFQPMHTLSDAADLRASAERVEWRLLVNKVSQALRVYHLLYGVYPGDLEVLVDLELCSKEDLQSGDGRRVSYQLEGDGFRLEPSYPKVLPGRLEPSSHSAVSDFFLNPQYVQPGSAPTTPPVAVLD